jgi:integrase
MNGHIRKRLRADGSAAWQVRIRDGGPEQLKTFDRKRDAERFIADRRAARLRGDLIHPDVLGVTVAELAKDWEATWPGRLQPTSQLRYRQLLRLYVLPGLGSERAATLSHGAVARFLMGLSPTLAPSTIRKVHATLSALFTEGIRSGVVRVNPCARQRLPRVERTEKVIIDQDEAEALASAAVLARDQVAIRLALYTGVRAGELWALRRRDVDLLHSRLLVGRALKNVGGRLEFGPTKSYAARQVSVPSSAMTEVEALLAHRPVDPEALLFVGDYGSPVRHNLWLSRVWRVVVKTLPAEKAGLRFHDLRHSHGSWPRPAVACSWTRHGAGVVC